VSERFIVQLDADQFDRLARPTQPLAGIAELIWNALDAEAEDVSVSIGRTDLDAVEIVQVADNGHGMSHDEATRDFRKLGGSWKKLRPASKNGKRPLHGKEGAGRFRAFAIGSTVEWSSIAEEFGGSLQRTIVTGSLDSSEFTVSDADPIATGSTGTIVQIAGPREHANRLLADGASQWLVTRFAVYLIKFPSVTITFDGSTLDPLTILENQREIPLDEALGGDLGQPILRFMQWKAETKTTIEPSLVLCDGDGVALHEVTDRIGTAPGIRFTAYLVWPGFTRYANDLLLGDLGHPVLGPVIEAGRETIQGVLDDLVTQRRGEQIEQWKKQNVYPYSGPAVTPAEVQERQVFDVVASTAAPAVAKEPKAAKLSLRLIKEALGQPPGALHRVLKEVLDLTPEQLADFDRLLERTTLASIIYLNKTVADRLQFLHDLEAMLFDSDKKQHLLERTELHRIIANGQTWVFGEQYTLAVDDQGLTKLLEAHLALLGRNQPVTEPVKDTEGHTRVVDLMLSKATFLSDHREHLVVELKRPKLRLSQTELNQITNYAIAVSQDERFRSVDVRWEFALLGDDMDEVVEALANQKDQPPGLFMQRDNYRVWVRRWAEVLEENRQRLHFYREHLDFRPDEVGDLTEVLGKYLPLHSADEVEPPPNRQ
jgi:hypothetical protein